MSTPKSQDPKSKGRDQIMGHAADNDGIEEYDNPLPDWWVGMFLLCIAWAFVYAINFHFVSGESQAKWYDQEVAQAEETWPQLKAGAVAKVDLSPEVLAAGKAIYEQNCVSCHGADMKGKIGPSLIDATWIHGGDLAAITATITNGVPEKGMLTWGPILGPDKVAKVAAFVYSSSQANGGAAPAPDAPPAPSPEPGAAPAGGGTGAGSGAP